MFIRLDSREIIMKRLILPILIIIAFVIAVPDSSLARKGRGHYKHYNHGHYKHHNHGHYKHYNRGYRYNSGPYFNANFFYGSAYYPRPYVYYAPPPPVIYAPPPVYYAPSYYPPVTGSFNFGIVID